MFGRLFLIPILAGGVLSSCVPNLGPLPTLVQPSQRETAKSFATLDGGWPSTNWWTELADPQLDQLIAEALGRSPDISIVAARVRQAEGLAEQAGAAMGPQVSGEASASGQKLSYNNGVPSAIVPKGINATGRLALNFSFDLDLWGRNRALLAAASSEAEAARVDLAEAALVLTTSIASSYADLARLCSEQDVLERAVRLQLATRDLIALRVLNGRDTRGTLEQAQSAVSASKVQLSQTLEQEALARNQIAALIGAGPDRGRLIARPAPTIQAMSLPADAAVALIGRRPDIVSARLRAAGAARRIDAARADFYPNISLSGLIGLQSLGLGHLLQGTSSFGNLGPALTLPIFHGGGLRGRYRQERGIYDEAVANYDRTLTNAFREVADAVVSRRAAAAQVEEAGAALASAERAYSIAQLRFRGGLSTYLDVLSAEQSLLAATRVQSAVNARRLTLDIALIRALGGGYQSSPPVKKPEVQHG